MLDDARTIFFARSEKTTDVWLTPPELVKRLGRFDLDPCKAIGQPWDLAERFYTEADDGLSADWGGDRVWMNPPYGSATKHWLRRLAKHGNGIAMVFARVETQMFFESVWGVADAILFIEQRVSFYTIDGKCSGDAAGAPSCLIAYGAENVGALRSSGIRGSLVDLRQAYVHRDGATWRVSGGPDHV